MPGPKADRNGLLDSLTSTLFNSLLEDVVMDIALEAHLSRQKSRIICPICKTQCTTAHNNVEIPSSSSSSSSTLVGSQSTISSENTKGANGSGSASGTQTPLKTDGTQYYECVNCSRQIASNRYAPHLSSCMGLGTSRRAGRNLAKVRPEVERSVSPGSDGGNSDEALSKVKSKKPKRPDEDYSLKRKRLISPQTSPTKKQKQGSTNGSPVPVSKVPSKLRESSTASFVDRSVSPTSSQTAATPASSTFSPRQSSKPTNGMTSKGKAPVPKRPSPPRQTSSAVHYLDDDDGDETGSSTDDSS